MKRTFVILVIVILIMNCFTGCSNTTKSNEEKFSIVATIFPVYDFSRQICGDNMDVTMLLPPGSESHSYEPSPKDIIKIQNSDLFIYVGGENDSWVNKIIESMDKPVKTIKMMDCVSIVEEEAVEGMEKENESEGEVEYDEHVWTSPKNAVKIIEKISEFVCEIDNKNKEIYTTNKNAYVEKVNRLDSDFKALFDTVKNKTLVFGDRFPLRYFVDAYGLKYYAAFPGCSNETEPSAATIAFLIDKVKSENISTVFYIELSNHKVADNIAEATKTKTALFNTCHNVSKDDFDKGVSYVSLMAQNLTTLKEAMR